MIERLVSGGQTGVDRAALDCALELGIAHGGFVPRGRRAEDGIVPDRFTGMLETESADYRVRTARNVACSDATLIISRGPLEGGSLLTRELAIEQGKPHLHLDLALLPRDEAVAKLGRFLADEKVVVLNVAGPRASRDAAIGALTADVLRRTLT